MQQEPKIESIENKNQNQKDLFQQIIAAIPTVAAAGAGNPSPTPASSTKLPKNAKSSHSKGMYLNGHPSGNDTTPLSIILRFFW
jgi:hypothetical protein